MCSVLYAMEFRTRARWMSWESCQKTDFRFHKHLDHAPSPRYLRGGWVCARIPPIETNSRPIQESKVHVYRWACSEIWLQTQETKEWVNISVSDQSEISSLLKAQERKLKKYSCSLYDFRSSGLLGIKKSPSRSVGLKRFFAFYRNEI